MKTFIFEMPCCYCCNDKHDYDLDTQIKANDKIEALSKYQLTDIYKVSCLNTRYFSDCFELKE
jgi:hypothetical protein